MPDSLSIPNSDAEHSMRILIVDDHALLVEGLSNLLNSRGFEVVGTASNGQEGVHQASRLDPVEAIRYG